MTSRILRRRPRAGVDAVGRFLRTARKPWSRRPTAGSTARSCRSTSRPCRPIKELDARNAKAPPRFEVKAPEGAPNVVIVLIDDIGFGALERVRRADQHADAREDGGQRPALQPLPHHGALQPDAHRAAHRPQPPRQQRRRDHGAGDGVSRATPASGRESVTPLAQILRLNGYSTAAFGKYHETPPWEVSVSGPFDRWPTGSGFDKFYGFIGGETNQWAPAIFDGVTRVEHRTTPELSLHDRHDEPGDQLGAARSSR